jgi:ureidoacrylate peracid hydrolase
MDLIGTGVPLVPSQTAVLVIDMQYDFCDPAGAMAARGADLSAVRAIIPPLADFVARARDAGVHIVHIQTVRRAADVSPALSDLWRRTGVALPACEAGSWGIEIVPGLTPGPDDMVITKTRYSAFVGTELDARLRALGVTTLVPTGVATNVCVESTWRHGFMLDYFVVVPVELVACGNPAAHAAALQNLERYFGVAGTAADLLEAWRN